MKLLALSSSSNCLSLAAGQRQQHHQLTLMQAQPSAQLPQLLNQLMVDMGWSLSQLDGLLVDVGPGAFTGVRLGLSVAQGLAWGLGLPVAGLDALSAVAWQAQQPRAVIALDARMGQLYVAVAEQNSLGQQRLLLAPQLLEPHSPPPTTAAATALGSGFALYPDLAQRWQLSSAGDNPPYPQAQALLSWAEADEVTWLNADQLQPLYVRNQVAVVKKTRPM